MERGSVRTWLYFNRSLEDSTVKLCIAAAESSVDGWVCTEKHAAHLGNTAQVTYIACTAEELNGLLHRNCNVFVPWELAESIELLNEPLSDYEGQLWLEDNYVSRYLVVNRLDKVFQTTATIGFAGVTPEFGQCLPNQPYAYICRKETEATSISAAIKAGARDLWLHISSLADVQERIRKIADIVEATELTALFAGMSPVELEKVWEQRLCLVARRSLPARHRITEEDLIYALASGGLSVNMLDRVVGKRLRYPLSPQAALTFGMLEC